MLNNNRKSKLNPNFIIPLDMNTLSKEETIKPATVLSSYGKMLRKKYAYGGVNDMTSPGSGTNWGSFLDARDEDLINNFAEDPNNPYNQEDKKKLDATTLGTGIAQLGISAINAFGTDEEDRITGKGVRQQAGKTALSMGATGAKVGSMFGPWGTLIGGAAGLIGGGIAGTVSAKNAQQDQADHLKELYYGAFGGELPTTNDTSSLTRKQQSGFTLRPNKYGDQNYFDYIEQGQIDLGVDTTHEQSAQTEKIGLWESILHASKVNKNTRESGRDVGRVKLNAFVDRDVEGIPSFAMGGDIDEISGPRHDQGGVQITKNAEVEGGEVKVDNYIFSDRLGPEGSKYTFADLAKKTKGKYEERPGDGPSMRAQEAELTELMKANEDARYKQEAKDKELKAQLAEDAMAYGGCIRKKANGGSIEIDPSMRNTFTKAAKARGMGIQEYASKLLSIQETGNSQYEDGGPLDENVLGNPDALRKKVMALSALELENEKFRRKYPDGGPITEPTSSTSTPVEVYPGHPDYEKYTAWKKQNETYNTYNTVNIEASTKYGEGTSYSASQFKSIPGMTDFSLPEGATGVSRYKVGTENQYQASPTIQGNYYTDTDGGYVYLPTYAKPEGDYKEVKSPEAIKKEEEYTAYQEQHKNIQGWTRNIYSEQQADGTWVNKTEMIPLKNGQKVPTNGTFVPKGTTPPKDYVPPGTTPTKAYGGNLKYDGGGPFEISAGPQAGVDPEDYFAAWQQPLVYAPETNPYYGPMDQEMMKLPNSPVSKINTIPFNETMPKPSIAKTVDPTSIEALKAGDLLQNLGKKGSTEKDSKTKDKFKVGNEELALLMSNLPAVDNMLRSFRPETHKLNRVKPEEIDLQKQRDLVDRQATIGRNISKENIRGTATSSGAALSALASNNSAISESVIQSHLQSLMNEETTNVGIRNQANLMNTEISNQEVIANEQNRAMADSLFNLSLADTGTNTAAYLRDKKMASENIRQNKRLMSIINSFAPNYKWEDDNGEFAIQFITAANLNNKQLPQ